MGQQHVPSNPIWHDCQLTARHRVAELTPTLAPSLPLLFAPCVAPSSLAQNPNPLGALLGNKNQAAANQANPAPPAVPTTAAAGRHPTA